MSREVRRNVNIWYKDTDLDDQPEEYAEVDQISVFKDNHGIGWLLLTFFGNATCDNLHDQDETVKVNIPLDNIKKFETIDDFVEGD
jgi:hypothetical protein